MSRVDVDSLILGKQEQQHRKGDPHSKYFNLELSFLFVINHKNRV